MKEYKLFINGEWKSTVSGSVIDDINPANGEVVAKIHTAGPDELEEAIVSATEAQKKWASLLASERELVLLRAADYLEKNTTDIAARLIAESGSTFTKSMSEIEECINVVRAAAGECRKVDGEIFPADMPSQLSYCIRVPRGVVAGISPFNFPLMSGYTKSALAIAAGNAVILKSASDTPISGIVIAESFEFAGLPKGVLNVICGSGAFIGTVLAEDPRVNTITFTGSTDVGRDIATRGAVHFKKCTLEMGGKGALIILKDYDVDTAVDIAAFGSYFNSGQICMASSRLIVEADIYDEFCKKMTAKVKGIKCGDPTEKDTIVGPLINGKTAPRLDAQIADATDKGARLLTGGNCVGNLYEPSLLADVTPDMTIFYEESFGPLASIIKAKDWEDALSIANNSEYGLSSAVLTNDINKAHIIALNLEAGMVHINASTVMGSRRAPFGGVKESGMGRENGTFSIEECTELKWITLNYEAPEYPV